MIIKIILSVAIILGATAIGKKMPATAGLIAVMPLTGALVLVWLYIESKGDAQIMQQFSRAALWGILPSILFFIVAFICFKKQLTLPVTLISSFAAWLGAAFLHHWFLK